VFLALDIVNILLWLLAILVPVLIVLAFVAGAIQCWVISRRPRTNRKCALALMLLLIAWVPLPLALGTLAPLLGLPPLSLEFLTLVCSALIIAAAVLAVIGLREFSGTQGYYTQGRRQAVATLLGGPALVIVLISNVVRDRSEVVVPPGQRVMRFDELNFKFYSPGEPWTQLPTNSLIPRATLAFKHTRPELQFLIIAEPALSADYSAQQLADEAIAEVLAVVDRLEVVYRGPTKVRSLEGIRLHSRAERSGQAYYCEHRLFATNGWNYQLLVWGREKDTEFIAYLMEWLAPRFEQLDPSGRPPTSTNSVEATTPV